MVGFASCKPADALVLKTLNKRDSLTQLHRLVRIAYMLRYLIVELSQLSLLPSAERKMSTGQSALGHRTLAGTHTALYSGRYGSFHGQKCGWQVKRCDPSLTRAIAERFRD